MAAWTASSAAVSFSISKRSSFLPPRGDEPGLVGLAAGRGEDCGDGPVFAGAERLDLHLALDDEAEADRLDAARGFRAGKLAPENRREVEAHEIIERAAGEVGLHQLHIHVAGVLHRLCHRGFGDRVEDHAGNGGVLLDRPAFAKRLFEVPGDRLTLTVRVGGENQRVVVLQGIGDGFDMLLRIVRNLPCHGKSLVGIDRSVLGRQVAHVAITGQHLELGSKILVDCLGFSRRFDDDDGHGTPFREAWGRRG